MKYDYLRKDVHVKYVFINKFFICGRWYPPGHGDFYQAFANSGLLDELIEKEGRSVCFMSNIDNMGATVDLSILHQFIANQNEFIMEVNIQLSLQGLNDEKFD